MANKPPDTYVDPARTRGQRRSAAAFGLTNMNRRHLMVAAGVIFAVVCLVYARSMAPHPTVDKIADTWVGFNEDDLSYFRLTLGTNGTGLCSSTFVREPAVLYRVTQWTLRGYDIEIMLQPIDAAAEPIWMKGSTAGWHLDLQIGGKTLKWKRKLKLYRESDVQAAHTRVKERMSLPEREGGNAEHPPAN